ncbi:MarR family winged helix-turn-helix transcriptional regulator [Aquipuribacter hungaricus]|uniref:MarR family winged helix-turn-helix transcriptional regulator n=1 Tax=Aquipuribacter hungaricus TaxID=545624 RepID=A0ABV7WHM8_9MICO
MGSDDGTPAAGDPAWLSAEQQASWRDLMALVMTLPAALDAQLRRDAGVNGFEYQVLAALSEAPDRALVLTTLAGMTQGSLSRLSHAVTRLERAGLVERRSCSEAGARRTEARLTASGWEKLQEIAPGHVREARRLVVDVLTPEQLWALGEASRLVAEAARAGAPAGCDGDAAC